MLATSRIASRSSAGARPDHHRDDPVEGGIGGVEGTGQRESSTSVAPPPAAPRGVPGRQLPGTPRGAAEAGVTDVDDSALTRALYSSDASLYRVVPQVVVRPRAGDDLDAILDVASVTGVPVTMRGAGTSIAGNAVGPGIVVDTVKHLDRVVSIDPEARTAEVLPGVIHANLQRAAAPHGLRFGPDPSTHTRCTIGGMIGNNACGSRALGYGRTVDNVVALDVAWGPDAADVETQLGALVDQHLAHVRTEFGRFTRQVSGYSLEHLLPEHGRNLERFLVGSEGTLAVVRKATVRLVDDTVDRLLVVLGYPSMVDAADAVPALLAATGGAMTACATPVRVANPCPDAPRDESHAPAGAVRALPRDTGAGTAGRRSDLHRAAAGR